jgi:hypothetical protein
VPAGIRTLAGGRLNLCVVQLAQSSLAQISGDQKRPEACIALRHVLDGGDGHANPLIKDIAPGASPVIILTPEYAFGHEDWQELDELVRAQQRPILLIAGFGATKAAAVHAWATEGGDTKRQLSWNPAQLSPMRPVNGGWCWLHGFGVDTTCVAFLKNHMEQGTEQVALGVIQSGTHLLRLSFGDLDVFPMICADMVQTLAQGEETAVHRIRAVLDGDGDVAKPILVTGSLVQGEPSNPNWAIAIDQWLHQIAPTRHTLVALANVAIDKPVWPEEQDGWRSLTGVFSRMAEMPKNQANLSLTRGVGTPSVRGAVLRLTRPYVAGGPLAWPKYGPTGEQFFWHVPMGAPLDGKGVPLPVELPPNIETIELARFARRAPIEPTWSPRVAAGLKVVVKHIEDKAAPPAAELLPSLLYGVDVTDHCSPDNIAAGPIGAALVEVIHGLATLVTEPQSIAWRTAQGQVGQLVLQGAEANILLWRDPRRSGRVIGHAVAEWTRQPETHPTLLVLAQGRYGQVEEGLAVGHPRDNITTGPEPDAPLGVGGGLADHVTDITEPQRVRSAVVLRLDRLIELYMDYEPDHDEARMADLIASLAQAAQAA